MKARILNILVWTLLLAGAGAGAWLAFRPAPVPCDLGRVDRGRLVVTVDEDGRTRLKDRYIVSAPLAGRGERITLRAGDPVQAGTTVLTRITAAAPTLLDERARAEALARVRAAEAAVARAEVEVARTDTELKHIQEEYERVRAAAESLAASRLYLEDEVVMLRTAEHARSTAGFSLQMSRYELEQANAALVHESGAGNATTGPDSAPFQVRSPITGKVLRVLRESAGVVAAGEPLMELGSLEQLEVELDVLSDQAVKVRPGARVTLDRWGGEQPLAAVVRVVEPSGYMKVSALGVEEQRVNVIIDFLDGPEKRPALGDNFRVEAKIVVWENADALRVPLGALFRHEGDWMVYVLDRGRAARRGVKIGQRSDRFAEVLDGLSEGDRVIVFPNDKVADGVRVTPRAEGA